MPAKGTGSGQSKTDRTLYYHKNAGRLGRMSPDYEYDPARIQRAEIKPPEKHWLDLWRENAAARQEERVKNGKRKREQAWSDRKAPPVTLRQTPWDNTEGEDHA